MPTILGALFSRPVVAGKPVRKAKQIQCWRGYKAGERRKSQPMAQRCRPHIAIVYFLDLQPASF